MNEIQKITHTLPFILERPPALRSFVLDYGIWSNGTLGKEYTEQAQDL